MANKTGCLLNATSGLSYSTTQHGNDRVLCIYGAAWRTALSIITFFATNYVAHAATVKSSPGDSTTAAVTNITLALLFPMSGFMRSINAIARCAIRGRTQLETACLAGALCMVVRKSGWKPIEGQTIEAVLLQEREAASAGNDQETGQSVINLDPLNEAEELDIKVKTFCPPYAREDSSAWAYFDSIGAQMYVDLGTKRVHGTFSLPHGYTFAIVPRNTRLKTTFTMRNQVSTSNSPTSMPSPTRNDISSSYSMAKALASLVQTLAAFGTLLGHRDDLIERWGYASFHLTVLPYLVMTLFNFAANTITPDYPCLYMVESSTMDEARGRGGVFVGTVAATYPLGMPHEVSQADLKGWEGLRGRHLHNLLVPAKSSSWFRAFSGLGAYTTLFRWMAILVQTLLSFIISKTSKAHDRNTTTVSMLMIMPLPQVQPGSSVTSRAQSGLLGNGSSSSPRLSVPEDLSTPGYKCHEQVSRASTAESHSHSLQVSPRTSLPETTDAFDRPATPTVSTDTGALLDRRSTATSENIIDLSLSPCTCEICACKRVAIDLRRRYTALMADPTTGNWALLTQSLSIMTSSRGDLNQSKSFATSFMTVVTIMGGGEFFLLSDFIVDAVHCYQLYHERAKVAETFTEFAWALLSFEVDLLKAAFLPPKAPVANPDLPHKRTVTICIPICSRFERDDDFSKRSLAAVLPGFGAAAAPRAKRRGHPPYMMAVEACIGLLAIGQIILLVAYFSHWFSGGASSTTEKVIVLLWMCEGTFGMLFAMAGLKEILLILVFMPVYIVAFAGENPLSGIMYILWLASLAAFVPPIWGFVLVARMLVERGQCVTLY